VEDNIAEIGGIVEYVLERNGQESSKSCGVAGTWLMSTAIYRPCVAYRPINAALTKQLNMIKPVTSPILYQRCTRDQFAYGYGEDVIITPWLSFCESHIMMN